ncbi:hypothetical protein JCM10450v2_000645 [Rhodotorula kratochvilovae]
MLDEAAVMRWRQQVDMPVASPLSAGPMVDKAVQTGENGPGAAEPSRKRRRTEVLVLEDSDEEEREEGEVIETPLPAPPPPVPPKPASPSAASRPPGPVFDFISTPDPRSLPPSLSSQLHTVTLTSLDARVDPALLLEFLLVRRSTPFPRPLALKHVASSATLLLAFRSPAAALRAAALLSAHAVLPLLKAPLRPSLAPQGATLLAWGDLSAEVRELWRAEGRLPEAEWVGESPHPKAGVKVSEGYEREWRRIVAAEAEAATTPQPAPKVPRRGAAGAADEMPRARSPASPLTTAWEGLPRPPIAFLPN